MLKPTFLKCLNDLSPEIFRIVRNHPTDFKQYNRSKQNLILIQKWNIQKLHFTLKHSFRGIPQGRKLWFPFLKSCWLILISITTDEASHQPLKHTWKKIVVYFLFCYEGTKHVSYTFRSAYTCISPTLQSSENMGEIVHLFEPGRWCQTGCLYSLFVTPVFLTPHWSMTLASNNKGGKSTACGLGPKCETWHTWSIRRCWVICCCEGNKHCHWQQQTTFTSALILICCFKGIASKQNRYNRSKSLNKSGSKHNNIFLCSGTNTDVQGAAGVN